MSQIHRRLVMAAITSLAVVSCGTAGEINDLEDELNIGQFSIRLEGRGEACFAAATADGKTQIYNLHIPWPCNFHRDMTGNFRIVEVADYRYVLIESSKRQPTTSRDCETHLRSIRVIGRSIEISQHKDLVASCPPFQWDSYVFWELFD